MLTSLQIACILAVLAAFGVDQTEINNIQNILEPTVQVTPVTNPTPSQSQPVNLGSEQASTQQTPVPQAPKPTESITVHVGSTTPAVGTGMSQISATSYVNGVYTKMPINVTTNDPDLPSQFIINQPGQVNYFCVAPTYPDFPNHGCQNENPATVGTFAFSFGTDQGVLASTTITVLP